VVKEIKKEEVKKDDLVSVEMTQAQKEKVAKILLADEDKAKAKKEMSVVTLKFDHYRNGVQYGPGQVRVNSSLASSLAAADDRAYEMRLKENQTDNHLIKIIGHGRTVVTRVAE
jgi:hypothetical protein